MYENSIAELDENQVRQFTQLITEFQDVFAKNESDLGGVFTDIQHRLDTGTSRPIKQKMRHTPLCFAAEEEAHLEKMLKAGVIQPSMSEWASPPVLIRKRERSAHWCVDYRALTVENNI